MSQSNLSPHANVFKPVRSKTFMSHFYPCFSDQKEDIFDVYDYGRFINSMSNLLIELQIRKLNVEIIKQQIEIRRVMESNNSQTNIVRSFTTLAPVVNQSYQQVIARAQMQAQMRRPQHMYHPTIQIPRTPNFGAPIPISPSNVIPTSNVTHDFNYHDHQFLGQVHSPYSPGEPGAPVAYRR